MKLQGIFVDATTPFDHTTLTALYRSRQAYLDAFDQSLDRAVALGFVRAEYAAEARAVSFG